MAKKTKKNIEETKINNEENKVRILTSEEYEQLKKDRSREEKLQYSFRTRFRAIVIEIFLSIPILVGILGIVPILGLLFNFKLSYLIIIIAWGVVSYIGFLIAKYITFSNKELWEIIDKKDNPHKYK